ncbi:MAG: protein-export chaperone SecB [Sneathiella sp.]|jgi:preprotein translocase subunit SecB|uniref:protein-export chaperone SecB n=1 Tax=Sneathiella sp. TaxID=1964365 RepID=UPI000C4B934A|nr:protein-export chaperone SecB [Sneathiella sp.]MAL79253.1 protein-export chaperone SecB [Sneathiella sp.]
MSEEGQAKAANGGADGQTAQKQPALAIIRQYVKDLSFENPNAPGSLDPEKGAPEVQLGVNIQARAGDNDLYEIELRIEVKANHGEQAAFIIELVYGGFFVLRDFPPETLEMVCMIECPRLLFPFARRVVADVTRDGGYSPLMLEPIDFAKLYRDHKGQMAGQTPPVGHA